MARARYVYEGLDEIAERLRRNAADIGYIVLVDRTDRRTSETLARFDFDEGSALPYLSEDDDAETDGGYQRLFLGPIPDDDPDDDDGDDEDEDEDQDDEGDDVATTR